MKIVHVVNSLDPSQGGPPVVSACLAASQAKLGYEVAIICYGSPNQKETDIFLTGIPDFDKVRVTNIDSALGYIGAYISAGKIFFTAFQPGDIIHLHGIWDPILLIAAIISSMKKTEFVIAPHGMLDSWSLKQKKWKKMLALKLVYRSILSKAKFIHVLNPDEARLMKSQGFCYPMEIIPNGIFYEQVFSFLSTEKPNYSPGLLRPYVLFLGRLHFKKGLDYLADAFAIIAKQILWVDLVVAGPDQGAQTEFIKQIDAYGLLDRVHLIGPVYGQDKFVLLKKAHCFCLPSRQEGFSIAVIEAMACGVPVVVSKECHFPEITDFQTGAEVNLNPEAIANAICKYLQDDTLRKNSGLAGQKLVRTNFTWSKAAELAINFYFKPSHSK